MRSASLAMIWIRWAIAYLLCALCAMSAVQGETGGVRGYVEQVFVHGVPYEESRQWSRKQDVDLLIKMLAPRSKPRYWINAVAVLGIVGDDRAFCPLVEFLNRGTRAGGGEAFYSVPLALGYLVNSQGRKGNQQPSGEAGSALRILRRGVDPDFWGTDWGPELKREHGCKSWRPLVGAQTRVARLREELARRSVLGLALSGHPLAVDRLAQLTAAMPTDRDIERLFADLLPATLETAREIRAKDLDGYYGE
jgi:hypothetical protein